MFNKPTVSEVHDFLRQNNALIAHFSGSPPGMSSGFGKPYPHDLHHVLSGGAQSGLACSVVTPGDTFAGGGNRHAFGCIGVVVDLRTPDSLIAVAPHDAGSWVDNGVRHYPEQDICLQDLENSLTQRGAQHNEWGLRDFSVVGIIAVDPFEVWDDTPPGYPAVTSLVDVSKEFAGQRMITRSIARWWISEAEQDLYA